MIAGTWPAIPPIALITFLLAIGARGFFITDFKESLAVASIIAVFFFLIGGAIGFLIHGSKAI